MTPLLLLPPLTFVLVNITVGKIPSPPCTRSIIGAPRPTGIVPPATDLAVYNTMCSPKSQQFGLGGGAYNTHPPDRVEVGSVFEQWLFLFQKTTDTTLDHAVPHTLPCGRLLRDSTVAQACFKVIVAPS